MSNNEINFFMLLWNYLVILKKIKNFLNLDFFDFINDFNKLFLFSFN